MKRFFSPPVTRRDVLRFRLMILAAGFVFLYALILTCSPAVRYHSWNVDYRWMHWIGVAAWAVGFSLIYSQVQKCLPDSDPYILSCVALLSGWGLLTIWRLSSAYGLRQTIWLTISLFVFWLGIRFPIFLNWIRRYKYLTLTAMLLLTALTFVFGTYPGGGGPSLWLGWGGVYFQPSEALKLLLVIFMAAFFADRISSTFGLLNILAPSLILVAIAAALLIAQRDLGTASLLILIYTLLIYLASGKRRVLLISVLILAVAAIVAYQLFDVIQLRVNAWLNPWLDPGGRSYQIVQSIMAYSAGGLLGSGPGLGSPGVVPVAISDFIFSAIGEEMGLVGGVGLTLVIGLLVLRGFTAALRAANVYHRLLAAGITIYLAVQSILIMGGTLRLLPLTGVTLPFVSYGGTSLLVSFIAVLILLLTGSQPEEQSAPLYRTTPYLLTNGAFLAAILMLVLLQGWWALVRAPTLATRTDNPRRSISDRYVLRGRLLDRSNQPIAVNAGEKGNYTRELLYPSLGPVVGYTNAAYGQGGLEYGLDDYLRGLRGNASSTIWFSRLLYTQAPPGLDVRLSLDLNLQQMTDSLLSGKKGAIVLLNAQTGEVLAMSSSPSFDPNQLDDHWAEWIADPDSPLLNRAVQGQYPAGSALGPFLAANASQALALPAVPASLQIASNVGILDCALPVNSTTAWADIIRAGCPGAVQALANGYNQSEITQLYQRLGLLDQPPVPMPLPEKPVLKTSFSSAQSAAGEDGLKVSPLQMALAAAALSNRGTLPTPRIALAVNTPAQGWVVLAAGGASQVFTEAAAQKAANLLTAPDQPYWETTAFTYTEDGKPLSWYLGGSLPNWQGLDVAIALILEENDPQSAKSIGRNVLQSALFPQ